MIPPHMYSYPSHFNGPIINSQPTLEGIWDVNLPLAFQVGWNRSNRIDVPANFIEVNIFNEKKEKIRYCGEDGQDGDNYFPFG